MKNIEYTIRNTPELPAISMPRTAKHEELIASFCKKHSFNLRITPSGFAIDTESKKEERPHLASWCHHTSGRWGVRTYIKFNGWVHRAKLLEAHARPYYGYPLNHRDTDGTVLLFTDTDAMLAHAFASILRIKTKN